MPTYQMNTPITDISAAKEIGSIVKHLIVWSIKPNGFSISGDFMRISVPANKSIPADQLAHLRLTQV